MQLDYSILLYMQERKCTNCKLYIWTTYLYTVCAGDDSLHAKIRLGKLHYSTLLVRVQAISQDMPVAL